MTLMSATVMTTKRTVPTVDAAASSPLGWYLNLIARKRLPPSGTPCISQDINLCRKTAIRGIT